MRFFKVTVDKNYIPPSPVGWYGILDKKTLRDQRPFKMSKHLMFHVEKHEQMVFTDVVVFPCFMVSRTVRDIILKYDPFLYFVRVILYDREKKESRDYYLPFPESAEACKVSGNVKRSTTGFAVAKEQTEGKVIMKITESDRTHIIMRMDLVESILRRETIGIGLEKVQLV